MLVFYVGLMYTEIFFLPVEVLKRGGKLLAVELERKISGVCWGWGCWEGIGGHDRRAEGTGRRCWVLERGDEMKVTQDL